MICGKCGENTELTKEDYTKIMQDLSKMSSPLEMARHAQNCKVCSMLINMANAIVSSHMQEKSHA